jgi:class 3 adenylate cyclase
MLAAQQRLAAPTEGERPLWLKVAIQYGPVIAINANDRLDYFGTQVNLAARLVELSSGEDMILAESVFRDQEVAAALTASHLQADRFIALLKGFDQEEFQLWRVTRSGDGVKIE